MAGVSARLAMNSRQPCPPVMATLTSSNISHPSRDERTDARETQFATGRTHPSSPVTFASSHRLITSGDIQMETKVMERQSGRHRHPHHQEATQMVEQLRIPNRSRTQIGWPHVLRKGRIQADDDETLDFMTEYLKRRPLDAKAYGLTRDDITRRKIAKIIPTSW